MGAVVYLIWIAVTCVLICIPPVLCADVRLSLQQWETNEVLIIMNRIYFFTDSVYYWYVHSHFLSVQIS